MKIRLNLAQNKVGVEINGEFIRIPCESITFRTGIVECEVPDENWERVQEWVDEKASTKKAS